MKTIYKYPLEITDRQDIHVQGSGWLDVQFQRGQLCLWMVADTTWEPMKRTIAVFGTGNALPDDIDTGDYPIYRYIGTAQQFGGELVWHVYEVMGEYK